jgi:hypothetical protein
MLPLVCQGRAMGMSWAGACARHRCLLIRCPCPQRTCIALPCVAGVHARDKLCLGASSHMYT